MKKGQTIPNVLIETIGYGGIGVGTSSQGKKILIKGSIIPHAVVDVTVVKVKSDHILGLVARVRSVNPDRADATPKCAHYVNPLIDVPESQSPKVGCGGCKRQIISYPKQLELKTDLVHDSFRATPGLIEKVGLGTIVPSPAIYQYRNKIEYSFGKFIVKDKAIKEKTEGGNWLHNNQRQLGFHKQGFYTHVVDVDQCWLVSDSSHHVFTIIKEICLASGLPVYDPMRHTGFFRHLVIRQAHNTGHILINLVVSTDNLITQDMEAQRVVCKEILASHAELQNLVTTMLITYNNTLSDAVARKDTTSDVLRGAGVIFEELHYPMGTKAIDIHAHTETYIIQDGQAIVQETITKDITTNDVTGEIAIVRFRISPFSFFQTNTRAAQELFRTAADMIGDIKGTIFDLYCGAGAIGQSFLSMNKGNFVVGIEIVNDAIVDAQYNAQINKMADRTYYVSGKTEHLIYNDPIIEQKKENLGLIILDPPREGLHKDVVTFLNIFRAQHRCKLLYISCNPVTLARDLDLLTQGNRTLQSLQPVDMFPHTHHVEMISVLT